MFNKHFKMNESDALLYVNEKLDFFEKDAQLKVEEIGDGNINYIFKIWDTKTGKSLIIKQADAFLRSSGRKLDVGRSKIEADVLTFYNKLTPQLSPKIYHYDSVMCAIFMEDISEYKNLRKELLERKKFHNLAEDISTFVVNTTLPTTDLVMDSEAKKDNIKKFINKDMCKISEDLVFTEPFIDYKNRNIVLPENLEFVQNELYSDSKLILEAGKLKNSFMNNNQALIHGDLHSGSIFVTKSSTKVLDPEFAFYGPIGYDLGNVIGNLFLAWSNVFVIYGDQEKEFIQWIAETIEKIIDLFKEKFIRLYKKQVTDVMAQQQDFMFWYLNSILSDTAGSAGLEIIRRIVGDAKTMDITSIEDNDLRVSCERMMIKIAKTLIMEREGFEEGKDYSSILQNYQS